MDAISYTQARQNLAQTMERVCEDHEAVIITRRQADSVVMMSLAEYEALEETAYLLRSPANAARLWKGIQELAAGLGHEHELIDEADLHCTRVGGLPPLADDRSGQAGPRQQAASGRHA